MKIKILSILLILSAIGHMRAQIYSTPESCQCTVDTLGLKSFLDVTFLNENAPLSFEVPNATSTFAVLHGVIGNSTPSVVQNFINNYPNVTTLVFMQMPGSENDTANLQAAQLLRNRGYINYLPSVNAYSQDAFVASGATDMLFSGNRRVIDAGAEVGVHSWSDGFNSATDFPVGHAVHQPYIDYYLAMGLTNADSEAFYYYTINAAPFNSVHFMTESEIEQYKLRTCIYNANPSYTISNTNDVLSANLGNALYQWVDCDNGNTPISGETNQDFTPTVNGNYAVEVTEGNCNSISNCISISSLSIDEVDHNGSFRAYPNPTDDGVVYFDFTNINEDIMIEVMDVKGKNLGKITSKGNEILTVNISDYAKGLYFFSVHTKLSYKTIKILIK